MGGPQTNVLEVGEVDTHAATALGAAQRERSAGDIGEHNGIVREQAPRNRQHVRIFDWDEGLIEGEEAALGDARCGARPGLGELENVILEVLALGAGAGTLNAGWPPTENGRSTSPVLVTVNVCVSVASPVIA